MKIERELMRGVGPVAVLKLLEGGPKYGYELVSRLSQDTNGILEMGQSTLYPLLYNLEAQGLVKSQQKKAESGRMRKYYSLTAKGKKRLSRDTHQWQAVAMAMTSLGVVTKSPGKLSLDGGSL